MQEDNPVINYFRSQEQDPIARAKLALAAARQYQKDWLQHGVNHIHLYYEDVEGDWLENWEPIDDKDIVTTVMDEEDYLQLLKDCCIARDIVYIKEDIYKNDLDFLWEVLDGEYHDSYSKQSKEELVNLLEELYSCYSTEDPFWVQLKEVLNNINSQTYTKEYIDNFIALFIEREKINGNE